MKREVQVSIFVLLIIISLFGFGQAAIFSTKNEGDFNNGTYDKTYYNSSGFVQLNLTYDNGTYTSQVFDAENNATWNNISWLQGVPYKKELPNNNVVESELGGANMSGNVLLLHMNEVSGTILDYSGYGNNGTQSGGVSYGVNGIYNTALNFDGSNDYVDFGNRDSLNYYGDEITFEIWVNPDRFSNSGGANYPSVIDKDYNDQYSMYFSNQGSGLAYLTVDLWTLPAGRNTVTSNNLYEDDTWYHIVLSYDGSDMKLYVNSVLDNSVPTNGIVDTGTKNLLIGAGWNGASKSYYLDGMIDEVAVYNKSLSSDEILNNYKRGVLRLNLSARSCDDEICDSENWNDINDSSSQILNLDQNRYFQYKYGFNTDNVLFSPELYNVSMDYSIIALPDYAPSSFLLNPENGSVSESQDVDFVCNASDNIQLNNMSLYWDYGDEWGLADSVAVNGTYAEYTFEMEILENVYVLWNCLVCDNGSQCSWAENNWSVIINYTAPEDASPNVTLNLPEEYYYVNDSDPVDVNFDCSAVDDQSLINISLYITNNENSSFDLNQKTEVFGDSASANWTLSLDNGNYTWNCLAYDNNSQYGWGDSNRTVVVNYSEATIPPTDDFPTTTLLNPENGNITTSQDVDFICNASDDIQLSSVSFYWNYSGEWNNDSTLSINGTENVSIFSKIDLNNSGIIWNCLFCDNNSQCSWAENNWSMTVNYNETVPPFVDNSPTISLELPANGYTNGESNPVNVEFRCSGSDDLKLVNISLYMTNNENEDFGILEICNINNLTGNCTWTQSLNNGEYTWNCLAYDNNSQYALGSNRTVTINYDSGGGDPPSNSNTPSSPSNYVAPLNNEDEEEDSGAVDLNETDNNETNANSPAFEVVSGGGFLDGVLSGFAVMGTEFGDFTFDNLISVILMGIMVSFVCVRAVYNLGLHREVKIDKVDTSNKVKAEKPKKVKVEKPKKVKVKQTHLSRFFNKLR